MSAELEALKAELKALKAEKAATAPAAQSGGRCAADSGQSACRPDKNESRGRQRLRHGDAASLRDGAGLAVRESGSGTTGATIFGYGEINYANYPRNRSQTQADLARAVIGFGYRFDDRTRFVSEFEWEHAITSADDSGRIGSRAVLHRALVHAADRRTRRAVPHSLRHPQHRA